MIRFVSGRIEAKIARVYRRARVLNGFVTRCETQRRLFEIVGVSGVGKTRLVQALFDDRVGKNSVNPSQVVYTNLSDDPNPQPVGLASDLIAAQIPVIMVIDNCPPDLHRRLTETCRQVQSTISFVTVEYDIRDDEPEETEVFRIEPSSLELIQKLIGKRFEQVSAIDAQTIANFSGGNARIAIALASTIGKNDKVTGLSDEDLFKRLFQQRHGHNADLLLVAQACSLVYSFEGESIEGKDAELPIFAALTGKTVQQVHAAVAELKRRDLVQVRGLWRAVLPHAIANSLARLALQNIPQASVKAHLANSASERLFKSFSRRLGYLNDSSESIRIVEGWFSADGLLGDLTNLTSFKQALLNNVAPIAPASVLSALNRTAPDKLSGRATLARLVRSIAYDVEYFDDSIELLARMAEADTKADKNSEAAACLVSMFYLYLSGTLAPAEQRLQRIKSLLLSDNPVRQQLGLDALDATLEAFNFSSSYSFDFGSRSRGFGWHPATGNDVKHWYQTFLRLLEDLCERAPVLAGSLKKTVATNFRGLYLNAGVADELDNLFRKIAAQGFWRDGWVAVRQTLSFDAATIPPKFRAKLEALERELHPRELIENVRAIVLGNTSSALDLEDIDLDADDNPTAAYERQEAIAKALGRQVAVSEEDFTTLIPELVRGHGRLWSFGRGLAQGAEKPLVAWQHLVDGLKATPLQERRFQLVRGFLNGLHGIESVYLPILLDSCLESPTFAPVFPLLQTAVPIDERGVERLHQCLALGIAPAADFISIAGGGATDTVPPADLQDLLVSISAKPDGVDAATEILRFRLSSDRHEKKPTALELVEAGRVILQRFKFKKGSDQHDHRIADLIKVALTGSDAKTAFLGLCDNFLKAVADDEIYAFEYENVVQALFTTRPVDALDVFIGRDIESEKIGSGILNEEMRHRKNPLAPIPPDDLIKWCDRDPALRYAAIASAIPLFAGESRKNTFRVERSGSRHPNWGARQTRCATPIRRPLSSDELERVTGYNHGIAIAFVEGA